MVIIKKYLLVVGVFAIGLLASCEKTDLRITEYDLPADKAYARFLLASPGTPSVMIKVNDAKINGTTTSGSLGVFPSAVSSGADYAAIPPNSTFRLSLPNIATANDSVLIFSGSLGNMSAGKYYTVMLADTGIDRTVFAIEDITPPKPDSGFFNIRFVNVMAKSQPLSLIRVDSTSPTAVITRDTLFRNVAFKQATEFKPVRLGGASVRYRTIVTATGQTVSTAVAPAQNATGSISMNYRAATIYATNILAGTPSVMTPTLVGFHINN
jgi:hypothetical protein